MKKLLAACCVLIAVHVYAQEKNDSDKITHSKIKFNSLVQLGVLQGEAKPGFQAQTINGIQYRSWSGGIGVGIDNYKFRTIPVFVDVRKNILNKASTPYVYADLGMQFPWVLDEQKNYWYSQSKFTRGLYYNLGAGYKVNIVKNNALIFSAAYSFKQINNKYKPYCDFGACPEEDYTQELKYTLRRISLMIGWNF